MIRPDRCSPSDDGAVVVVALRVQLDDAGEQEHLVVHRQPEAEGQHEQRDRRLDRADRREAEQPLQVPLLEDPDHDAEAGPERDDVEQQRLERDDQRAGHEEQQHERGQDDQADGIGARCRTERVKSASAAAWPVTQRRERRPVAARTAVTSVPGPRRRSARWPCAGPRRPTSADTRAGRSTPVDAGQRRADVRPTPSSRRARCVATTVTSGDVSGGVVARQVLEEDPLGVADGQQLGARGREPQAERRHGGGEQQRHDGRRRRPAGGAAPAGRDG